MIVRSTVAPATKVRSTVQLRSMARWITVISRTTGTFTGEMTMPDGTVISPTGKAFDLEFSQTVRWDGDQIVEILAFWDTALQAQQIGLA